MNSAGALLDTDNLSALMKGLPAAVAAARRYLSGHERLGFSIITRYEILRGLKAKRATAQLAAFDDFCDRCDVLPLDDAMIVRAADVYADLKRRGELIGDADILIAATALVRGLVVVTNNAGHFSRIRGLSLENWVT